MSRKINTFAGIITQPLNVYNFVIKINAKGVDAINNDILQTVQSTTFPTEQLREMTLNYRGEVITYPAKPQNGGDWSFTIPENDGGQIRKELDKLKNHIYDQQTGVMTPMPWFDVEVMQLDLQENKVFSVVLHGCWLKGRSNAQALNQSEVSTSWTNDYAFHYTWIEDKLLDDKQKSPDPTAGA